MSGTVYDDPTLGYSLLGLAAGLGQAAMPSRMPIPTGAALGMGAAGMMQAQQAAMQQRLQQQQLQAAQMQNQFNASLLPAKIDAAHSLFGSPAGSGGGVPGAIGGAGGGAGGGQMQPMGNGASNPADAGQADPALLATRELLQRRNWAQLNGDGRTAAAMQAQLDNIAGPGGIVGADGRVVQVPGAYGTRFAASNATEGGKVGPELAIAGGKAAIGLRNAGPMAAAEAAGRAPYQPPITYEADDGTGTVRQYTVPVTQWAQQIGGGGGSNLLSTALQSIPDPVIRQKALNAALSQKLPVPAIPAWISAIHNESGWNPGVADNINQASSTRPPSRDIGIGQINSGTLADMNVPEQAARNVDTNLRLSASIFGKKWGEAQGNPAAAMAGYNTGSVQGQAPQYVGQGMNRLNQWGGVTAQPVGIPGKQVMTPEQSKRSEGLGAQDDEIQKAAAAAPVSLQRLDVMDNAAQSFRPGVTGQARMDAAKVMTDALQGLGIDPPTWIKNGAAAGETIGKEGGYLASQMTRVLGSREAASVFQQVRSIQPNIEMSTGGFQAITNSLRQGLQRDQDLGAFRSQWLADPSHRNSIEGMQAAFEKTFPVQAYASRVVPYPMPRTAGAAMPNVIYNTSRGPARWNGSAFEAIQ